MSNSAPFTPEAKDRFALTFDALKDAYKEFLDLGLKISGGVLLVLAWFAAQADPFPFLKGGLIAPMIAIVLVVVGLGAIVAMFRGLWLRGVACYSELKGLGWGETATKEKVIPPFLRRYEMDLVMLWGALLVQLIMFGGLCWAILARYVFA